MATDFTDAHGFFWSWVVFENLEVAGSCGRAGRAMDKMEAHFEKIQAGNFDVDFQ
jgi:hypothetical protein